MLTTILCALCLGSNPTVVVVPSAAGNGTDIIARKVAARLPNTIVENRPGAGGSQGVQDIIKALPGEKILITSSSSIITAPYTIKNAGYTIKDLKPIGTIVNMPLGLTLAKKYRNIEQLKGIDLNFGVPGYGSTSHVMALKYIKESGSKATVIPFKGSAEVVTNLLTDRIDMGYLPRMLTTQHNLVVISEVDFWIGVYVHVDTSNEATEALRSKINSIVNSPEFAAEIKALDPSNTIKTESIDLEAEAAAHKKLVDEVGFNAPFTR